MEAIIGVVIGIEGLGNVLTGYADRMERNIDHHDISGIGSLLGDLGSIANGLDTLRADANFMKYPQEKKQKEKEEEEEDEPWPRVTTIC